MTPGARPFEAFGDTVGDMFGDVVGIVELVFVLVVMSVVVGVGVCGSYEPSRLDDCFEGGGDWVVFVVVE